MFQSAGVRSKAREVALRLVRELSLGPVRGGSLRLIRGVIFWGLIQELSLRL